MIAQTAATVLLLLSVAASAPDFPAKVARVIDGDSLRVVRDNQELDIRLEGIDCPESGQAFGNRAKQATTALALGKIATIRPTGTDKYGRTLANVILPDGRNLSQELVRLGCAWRFRTFSKDEQLGHLEDEARAAKRGLWTDPNPTPPWEWREANLTPDVSSASVPIVPNGVEIAAVLPNPEGKDEGNEQVVIRNTTDAAVDITGWMLRDRAGNTFSLSGSVPAKGKLLVTMTQPTMPLNNDGDEVVLVDACGTVRSRVVYSAEQARAGVSVEFGI